jgi:hypothetical protein
MDGAFLLNATMEQLIARADANSAAQIAAITQKAADQNAAVAALIGAVVPPLVACSRTRSRAARPRSCPRPASCM